MRKIAPVIAACISALVVASLVWAQPGVGISKTAPISGTGSSGSPLKLDVCSSGSGYVSNGTSYACALVGDITGVTAGTNLTGGGTSGSVTLNVSSSPSFSGTVTAAVASITDLLFAEAEYHADLAAGNIDDYTPTNWSTNVRHYVGGDDTSGSTITGLGSLPVGTIRFLELGDRNSHGPITLVSYEDSAALGSSGANRIVTPDNAPLKIDPGGMVALEYIGGGPLHGWRVLWSTSTANPRLNVKALRFGDSISATLAAGTTNDWAPTGGLAATRWRVTVDTNGSKLTGITHNSTSIPTYGVGEVRILENLGDGLATVTATLTLAAVGSGSLAENSFYTPDGQDVVLPVYGTAILIHDETVNGWRVLAVSPTRSDNWGVPLVPSALSSGDNNNWNPTGFAGAHRIRVTVNASGSTLTGMSAGKDGEIKVLEVDHASGGNLTLAEYRTSTGANRFLLPGLVDAGWPGGSVAVVMYDSYNAAWKLIGGNNYVVGDLKVTGSLDVDNDLATFGNALGNGTFYVKENTIGCGYAYNNSGNCYWNYYGYAGGASQYRNAVISDGAAGTIATFTGSSKATALAGALSVVGDVTLGDASSDRVGLGIAPDSDHPLTFAAATGNKIGLYPVSGTTAYGLGVQAGQLQVYVPTNTGEIALGYGDSDAFTKGFGVVGTTSTAEGDLVVKGNTDLGNAAVDLTNLNGNLKVSNDQGKLSTKSAGAVTLSTCGTGPSYSGDRTAATVATGTGATACTITFTTAFTNTPTCLVTTQSATKTYSYTVSTSAITISTAQASTNYDYICVDHY